MIKHFLTIGIRFILRSKTYSAINITCLTISLSITILVFKMIFALNSSDGFHPRRNDIYRIISISNEGLYGPITQATTPAALSTEVMSHPDIEKVARIWNEFSDNVNKGDQFIQVNGYFADPDFFKLFEYDFIEKSTENPLDNPFSVIITEKLAQKIFGSSHVIGETLYFNNLGGYTITGIIKVNDFRKSHLNFDLVASSMALSSAEIQKTLGISLDDWEEINNTYTYVLIKGDRDVSNFSKDLNNYAIGKYSENSSFIKFELQPLNEISPGKRLANSLGEVTDPILQYILLTIAILILITAGFTYTNLTISKLLSRAKEIGIKKIAGARKLQIFEQFIIESIIVVFISLFLAFIINEFLEPGFYNLDQNLKNLFYQPEFPFSLYLMIVGFSVLLGIISGIFPAVYMTKFKPAIILKDITKSKVSRGINLKKLLIVFQFFISITLMYSLIILHNQLNYQRTVDIGFDPKNIINVDLNGTNFQNLKNEVSKINGIENVSAVQYLPGTGMAYKNWIHKNSGQDSILISILHTSDNYLENLRHRFISGQDFLSDKISSNVHYTVINKSALNFFGFDDETDAIGQELELNYDNWYQIIGVIDDFVLQSTESNPGPLVILQDPAKLKIVNIRINQFANKDILIQNISKRWREINPDNPFSYKYYTSQIDDTYASPRKALQYLAAITFTAIFISILGLLGMVTFETESKFKEIGIRKVLGANSKMIIYSISKDFFKMLFIAILISSPITWIAAEMLLQNFYYRVELKLQFFILGILIAIIPGVLVVLSQTIRVSVKNAVEAIRYE